MIKKILHYSIAPLLAIIFGIFLPFTMVDLGIIEWIESWED